MLAQSWGDPLEEGMATHSSILAWRIPLGRGAWQARVRRVTRSRTWLKRLSAHAHTLRTNTHKTPYCLDEVVFSRPSKFWLQPLPNHSFPFSHLFCLCPVLSWLWYPSYYLLSSFCLKFSSQLVFRFCFSKSDLGFEAQPHGTWKSLFPS